MIQNRKKIIGLLEEYRNTYASKVIQDYPVQIELGAEQASHFCGINWAFRIMQKLLEGNVSTWVIEEEIRKLKEATYKASQRIDEGKQTEAMPIEPLA